MNKVLIRYSSSDKFERQKERINENFVDEYVEILMQCELVSNIAVFPITIGKLDED